MKLVNKKTILVAAVLLLAAALFVGAGAAAVTPTQPASGDGTSGDPWIVTNESELHYAVGENAGDGYIKLDAAITLSEPVTINKKITIDGNGKTVTRVADYDNDWTGDKILVKLDSGGDLTLSKGTYQVGKGDSSNATVNVDDGFTVIRQNEGKLILQNSVNVYAYGSTQPAINQTAAGGLELHVCTINSSATAGAVKLFDTTKTVRDYVNVTYVNMETHTIKSPDASTVGDQIKYEKKTTWSLTSAGTGTVTMTLLKDCTFAQLTSPGTTWYGDVTIDLGGHTLTITTKNGHGILMQKVTSGKEAKLTITNGTIKASNIGTDYAVISVGVTTSTSSDNPTLVIDSNVTIDATGSADEAAGILVATQAGSEDAPGVIVKGTIISPGPCIMGNGSDDITYIEVDGAHLTSINDAAIYQPQEGTLIIKDSVITGATGLYIKDGVVKITNSQINGTGAFATPVSGSGSSSTGDAILINSGYASSTDGPSLVIGPSAAANAADTTKVTSRNGYALHECVTSGSGTQVGSIELNAGTYKGGKDALLTSPELKAGADKVTLKTGITLYQNNQTEVDTYKGTETPTVQPFSPTAHDGSTVIKAEQGISYSLLIPDYVTLETGKVIKTSVGLDFDAPGDKGVKVVMTSNSVETEGSPAKATKFFMTHSDTVTKAYYHIALESPLTPLIASGDSVLESAVDASRDLYFELIGTMSKAGSYEGTITFVSSVVES